MYKRPRPLLQQIKPTPVVLQDAEVGWTRWSMSPIAKPNPTNTEATANPAEDIDHEAVRQLEQDAALQALREQAHQEGYAQGHAAGLAAGFTEGKSQGQTEGYEAGMAQANAVQEATAEQLRALLLRAEADITDMQESMGQALVQMGARIASHILGVQLRKPSASLLAIVNQILAQQHEKSGKITFLFHPADLALVQPHIAAELDGHRIQIDASPDLERGDVIARTSYGDIDATLKTRWDNAMAAIGLQEPTPKVRRA